MRRRLGQGSGDCVGEWFVGREWGEADLRSALDAFRRGLRGYPPARVEPLAVTFKPEAKVVKARGCVYSPIKTAWLAACIGTLVALGLVFRNLQAVWVRAALAVPKKEVFRLVGDYRAVNKQIEKVPGVMRNQEAEMTNLRGATCLGKLDMLQGYCQMRLAAEVQEVFSPSPPPKSVYPHAYALRRFERDGLLLRRDDRIVGRFESLG